MTRRPTIILKLHCNDCKKEFECLTTRPIYTKTNKKYCDICLRKKQIKRSNRDIKRRNHGSNN